MESDYEQISAMFKIKDLITNHNYAFIFITNIIVFIWPWLVIVPNLA